ncbi:conserved hypothetical protein [Leishmania infantum JPCM5]|uniref:UBA/TS-N_domain_containing_protein_-_putative n=3 Tax=Leishmania donovani species complex TaxID=38574 RepID=A0A6L0XGJ2_LEIIN|nr:conserved hypothetical protein [Leishmania infantum JPCM5]AYU79952.1 UBA/TS-N domain containing protein, putative [Leishmania donovani]CAC9499101.1 UBA/TS-N_domain_containing_protein_-_putative [Leishmania infantum]CBZ08820.1 conserved hypothetical protein [Leishmania infantum JPCM5]SUZ42954.1 UBA/TS-N_domain_containing_protein_-_putative [Leishmania infantum]|eukprot:XP_003392644.1 conserved hypothetical protein [Leishmania infantum JPCM5]
MEYQIISSKGDKFALCIDDDMTVGDVKGVAAAMLDAPDDVVMTVSLNGKLLKDDAETWGELRRRLFRSHQPHPMQRKLFCNVTDRPVVESQSAEMLRMLPSKEEKKLEQEKEREKVAAMDSMVDTLADNPAFLEGMLSMNPMIKRMQKKSPEVARMLKDPDTLRMLLKSSVDPQRRREMERNAELQLAHIAALPGGQQMINHYMDQLTEDEEETDAQRQLRIGRSTAEVSDEIAHPDPTKEANNDPLPNPWATPAATASGAASQTGGAFPFGDAEGFPFFSPFGFPPAAASSPNGAATDPVASSFVGGSAAASSSGPDQEVMNSMIQMMMQSMMTPPSAPTTATTDAQSPSTAAAPVPASPSVLSEETVQRGLSALREMGFEDEALCREALTACGGDAEAAVDYIAEHQEE